MIALYTAWKQITRGYIADTSLRRSVLIDWIRLLVGNRFVSPSSAGETQINGQVFSYSKRASLYGMFQEIFVAQNYYVPSTDKPLVILDCGANVGMASRYFLTRAPQARVVAFEPNPYTAALLRKNLAHHGAAVQIHEVGLGGTEGSFELYTDTEDAASQSASLTAHLKAKQYDVTPVQVSIQKLSSYINGPIDVLKMDIEGLEVAVVRELREANMLQHVKRLFIEYHFDGVHSVDSLGQMLSDIEASGFHYVIHSGIAFPFMHRSTPITSCVSYKITAWQPE